MASITEQDGPGHRAAALRSLPLLSRDAAAEIAEAVLALRAHWTPRHPVAPFYTLGAAAYLDATDGLAAYAALARRTNPLLRAHFGSLFDGLAGALAEALEAPVETTRRLALPGFHLYEPFFAFAGAVASLHWDRQQALLPWPDGEVPQAVLSLTLPLALPGGAETTAGLELWHRRWCDEPSARAALLRDPGPPATFVAYRPGVAVLHDGQRLHRARLMPADGGDGGPRITLQAHLAWSRERWEFYW